jgi:hypothetical protein
MYMGQRSGGHANVDEMGECNESEELHGVNMGGSGKW